MTLDHVENDEFYVLQNTDYKDSSPGNKFDYKTQNEPVSVLRIPLKHPYYASYYEYWDNNGKVKCVNDEIGNMETDTWYLLPQAYTIELVRK